MREPARKCQKEWSFEPPMCTVDGDQIHLSVQSGLCAWRSAPEQQIAIQRQGEWCLSPCHKLRPLPLSRRDQRPCSDEQMVESVPSAWMLWLHQSQHGVVSELGFPCRSVLLRRLIHRALELRRSNSFALAAHSIESLRICIYQKEHCTRYCADQVALAPPFFVR